MREAKDIIKAIRICSIRIVHEGCKDCPYSSTPFWCIDRLKLDAADALDSMQQKIDGLTEAREQGCKAAHDEIVRLNKKLDGIIHENNKLRRANERAKDISGEAELIRNSREKDSLIAAQKAQIETLKSRVKIAEIVIHKRMELETGHIDEIESLKNQVYNLTLYLKQALKCADEMVEIVNIEGEHRFTGAFLNDFDGMPGYNPEILEVRNETD